MSDYSVWRHDGNRDSQYRQVFSGEFRDCMTKYDIIAQLLRQGAVELRNGDYVVRRLSAPRLRTRW